MLILGSMTADGLHPTQGQSASCFPVADKIQGQIVQVHLLVRGFAHGDAVAVDLPDGEVIQLALFDLKNVVPASAFQIGGVLLDADELDGGTCRWETRS